MHVLEREGLAILSGRLVDTLVLPGGGVREARLSLFREIKMLAVLIELGFLTNQDDALQLIAAMLCNFRR